MTIQFEKYHGTGNDFIMIDLLEKPDELDKIVSHFQLIAKRRFGIGADGIICLLPDDSTDFRMIYFNADGNESTMCGNGGRCIIKFARTKNYISNTCTFVAIDGKHEGKISDHGVSLKMSDVESIKLWDDEYVLNTGSPHFVKKVSGLKLMNVYEEGKKIRQSARFAKEGINVNFIESIQNQLFVRTYERGVEDETYSCGTGVVASALAFAMIEKINKIPSIKTLGGDLEVNFETQDYKSFKNIWLKGPAEKVFEGILQI